MTSPLVITGKQLKIEDLVDVARNKRKVELHPDAVARIKTCRLMLEKKLEAKEIMYGTNTGIGEFSEVILNDEQVKQFQKYLIYNHAAGIGDPAPEEYIRATMLGRTNVLSIGNSGVRLEIVQTFVDMLNKGVTPYVCQKGSVGACGDLAPMAQIALLMMGEGKAYYQGQLLPGKEAMEKAGIRTPGLHARDGLAAINGSNMLTAMSAIFLYDANRWLKQAEIASAMSLEALKANMKPYNHLVHEVRGFKGAMRSAAAIRKCVQGGDLFEGRLKCKVQDAYSMRSTPQVIGAAHDALAYARSQVEIELNGVGDNPIFIPDKNLTLTGANFQGIPVSVPMEMAGTCVTMVSVLSERRLNRMTNSALSGGLPPFLATNPGLFSGLMLCQYTADTLIVEQKTLSMPACIQSIPAAADQEDFVSMGMNTAIKNFQILKNAQGVVGIEFMAAAQGLDLRKNEYKVGNGTQKAREVVRRHVQFLDEDRPLYVDNTKMMEVVGTCEILEEVEKAVGSLE